MIKVTVWNEFLHEKFDDAVKSVYPDGIHEAIAAFLKSDDITVRTATLDDPECGLTKEVIDDTDVLLWWGHMGHDKVPDEVAVRVQNAVLSGMGIIFLHSAHMSKPFRLLMGTSCTLTWRESGDKELLWVADPAHPIAQGIGRYVELEHEETYGEPYDIPEPDRLVFVGWFEGGEVFRSGACYRRGHGRVFYFQPGHETFPTYYNEDIQKIIRNAVYWANPILRTGERFCPCVEPIIKK